MKLSHDCAPAFRLAGGGGDQGKTETTWDTYKSYNTGRLVAVTFKHLQTQISATFPAFFYYSPRFAWGGRPHRRFISVRERE